MYSISAADVAPWAPIVSVSVIVNKRRITMIQQQPGGGHMSLRGCYHQSRSTLLVDRVHLHPVTQ